MLAELVFTYLFNSNYPVYIRGEQDRMVDKRLELVVVSEPTRFLRTTIIPFVEWSENKIGRGGATLTADVLLGNRLSVGFYHRSEHSLDRQSDGLKQDGVTIRWRLP